MAEPVCPTHGRSCSGKLEAVGQPKIVCYHATSERPMITGWEALVAYRFACGLAYEGALRITPPGLEPGAVGST